MGCQLYILFRLICFSVHNVDMVEGVWWGVGGGGGGGGVCGGEPFSTRINCSERKTMPRKIPFWTKMKR